ncbi:hypothetical protein Poly30_54090 [Planctomycetes bacterium Poly30]|uniref:Lipoprotein n=1 Tax=Saltatorellus ferox TaxID=2528018 RepID=A0A518F0K4_9BACT|nr:hypothetical protein Poly30_54090 [Planctomycetes bacterium Poly30]
MHKTPALVTLALFVASCQSGSLYENAATRESYRLSETPVDEAVEGRPTFGDPLPIPGSRSRIIPFSRESTVGWFGDRDHFSEGGLSSFADESQARLRAPSPAGLFRRIRWHNAAIHDLESGEQWTLLEERGVLSSLWIKLSTERNFPDKEARQVASALIFSATTADTNGDQKLNDLDGVRALVTDGDGRNPRLVTPPGTQLVSVQFDPTFDVAILMARVDLNGDGKFTDSEPPRPFLYRFGEDRAEPLLTEATLDVIEGALE